MTEKEFQNYIDDLSVRGSVYGTECMQALMDRLENVQDKIKTVQVAGTNGKGSTVAFLSTVLYKAGYKVGRYTSPAVMEYKEKYQINGRNISKKELYECMELVREKVRLLEAETDFRPTLFEVETAIAFVWFMNKNCDIAIIETGLGGRDDATNVIKNPLVSILTSISKDHMGILGNTLEQITTIKCGIIKSGSPAVIGRQMNAVVNDTVMKYCNYLEDVKPVFVKCGENVKSKLTGQRFDYGGYKKLEIGMPGIWQIDNACTVIEAVKILETKGFNISENSVRKGLLETVWPGRFNIIDKKRMFIIDGAHNEEAFIKLRQTVDELLADRPMVFIMGVFADKEYEKGVALLADRASAIVTVAIPGNSRALPAIELAEVVSKYNPNVTAADSVEEAVEMALLLADKISMDTNTKAGILAFGSLSYIGRIKKYLNGDKKLCTKIKA